MGKRTAFFEARNEAHQRKLNDIDIDIGKSESRPMPLLTLTPAKPLSQHACIYHVHHHTGTRSKRDARGVKACAWSACLASTCRKIIRRSRPLDRSGAAEQEAEGNLEVKCSTPL